MLNLKIGNKELRIKFAYEATVKSGIIKKMVELEEIGNSDSDNVLDRFDQLMVFVPEILLIGLQKFHRDEYGFNYNTGEGKDEAMSEVCSLLDDYFDGEDSDLLELFQMLQKELVEDGFLSKMFQKQREESRKARAGKSLEKN